MIIKLTKSKDSSMTLGNRLGLIKLVEIAENYKGYMFTASTWNVLTVTVDRSKQLLADPLATWEDVDLQIKELQIAIDELQISYAKENLAIYLGEADQMNEKDYPDKEIWNKFVSTFTKAKDTFMSAKISEEITMIRVDELQVVMRNLETYK